MVLVEEEDCFVLLELVLVAALQAPVIEGTALTPEPMGTMFVPQLAAGAMKTFILS